MSIKRAILFDMDGTIVDNMAYHTASWLDFFRQRGHVIGKEEFFLRVAGRQGREILREFIRADLPDAENDLLNAQKEAAYRASYASHRKPVPGFEALVTDAHNNGVALAVATAAPAENIVFTLDGLDIRRHFKAVVGAADVARGKPEPDVFLQAARQCGVVPEHCIAFEDSPLGVEAARRAGMRAVALTTTMPAAAFSSFDNVIAIASDFTSFTIASLFAQSAQPI
jgi:beta-phosphoglucomutase family hydrolase